jgi:two-component system, OmpR family, response regulator
MRVLIVEDSPHVSERLAEMVESLPLTSLNGIVATEADARTVLANHATDVAIVDINLKEGSGFGAMRFMRAIASKAQSIVFTNAGNPAYREAALALGASSVLDKACDFQRLTDLLTQLAVSRGPTESGLRFDDR